MAETIPAPHSIQIWFHWMEPPLTKGVRISLKIITVTQNGRSIARFVNVQAKIAFLRSA